VNPWNSAVNVNADSAILANVLKSSPVNVILCNAHDVNTTTNVLNVIAFRIFLSANAIVCTNAAPDHESIYIFPVSVKYAFDWISFGNINTFITFPEIVSEAFIVISVKSLASVTPLGLVNISTFSQYAKLIPLYRNSFSDIPPYRLSFMNGINLSFLSTISRIIM